MTASTHLSGSSEAPAPLASATHLLLHLPRGAASFDAELARALHDERLEHVTSAELVLADQLPEESLGEVIRALARSKCRHVELVCRGAQKKHPIDALVSLHRVAADAGAELTQTFVLGTDADAFLALGKKPTSLAEVFFASKAARTRGVLTRWVVPIIAELAHRLEGIFSLASDERLDAVLVPTWAIPAWPVDGRALSNDERGFVKDFLQYRLLDEDAGSSAADRLAYYRWLLATLDGAGPHRPAGARPIAELRPHEGGAALRILNAPSLTDAAALPLEPAGGPQTLTRAVSEVLEMGGVVLDGDRALVEWAQGRLRGRSGRAAPDVRIPSAMLIGAYGGEHIGDIAILGGVLHRIHARHGTERGVLMSQRPEHTRRLVAMLDTPVEVTVAEYTHEEIRDAAETSDGLVYAGGPLMDLPKQLVLHLYAASKMRARGKPVILEGIGAGPFVRKASEWTARRITEMADSITLRTSADAQISIVRDLEHRVGRDPAFDYLETRGELTRLTPEDAAWVERLTEGDEAFTVAINLRPIRAMFTAGEEGTDRESYTRFVEARFEERLAEALERFSKEAARKVRFIFYPMNSIQFGSSDLRSAYRVQRLLRADVDLRVWQGDPTVDGVVALLRKVDVAIAMRFHANIFALSQSRSVIGIDYRPGKKDKVEALLEDRGIRDRVGRIDALTADWLVQQLMAST